MVIPISQERKLRVELLVTQPRSRGQPVLQLELQPRRALYSILALAYCRATQRARHVVVIVQFCCHYHHHLRRRQWHPTLVLLPGESHDGGAWWAAVHGVARSRIRLSDFTFTFHFHALEKEMTIHSSVLAWRIPGTGEPDGLPSMGSHRVGHD